MAGPSILTGHSSGSTFINIKFTVDTLVAIGARTVGPTNQINASGAILTRVRRALINVSLTVTASEPQRTLAAVGCTDILALATIQTLYTLNCSSSAGGVDDVTQWSGPPHSTLTLELACLLDTPGTVLAHARPAPVHKVLTTLTGKSRATVAAEAGRRGGHVEAGADVETRTGAARQNSCLTVRAGEVIRTATRIGVDTIHTRATIQTRTAGTVVVVSLTVQSTEARQAVTGEGVDKVVTAGSVVTRIRPTLVDVSLTLRPRVPR